MLHDEVGHAGPSPGRNFVRSQLAEIAHGDDVRMADGCCRLGFANEARDELGVLRDIAPKHLQRKAAIERGMAHFVDRAHATLAEDAEHFVATRDDTPEQRVGRWVPIRSLLERIAIERAETRVAREQLSARRATMRGPAPWRPRLRRRIHGSGRILDVVPRSGVDSDRLGHGAILAVSGQLSAVSRLSTLAECPWAKQSSRVLSRKKRLTADR